MYHDGLVMPQSHEEAARLFEQAAEQGHADAQAIMGDYCREGLGGVIEDFSAAMDWYEQAAKQGNQYARRPLGGEW